MPPTPFFAWLFLGAFDTARAGHSLMLSRVLCLPMVEPFLWSHASPNDHAPLYISLFQFGTNFTLAPCPKYVCPF